MWQVFANNLKYIVFCRLQTQKLEMWLYDIYVCNKINNITMFVCFFNSDSWQKQYVDSTLPMDVKSNTYMKFDRWRITALK